METPPRPPSRPGRLRDALIALAAVLSLVVAGASGYLFYLYKYADKSFVRTDIGRTIHIQNPTGHGRIIITNGGFCSHDICDYLVTGNDSRKGLSKAQQSQFGNPQSVPGQRSDTIMLVRVDPRTKKTVVLSFPRDLWVKIPGHGHDKITSAYGYGGPPEVADVVARVTGLPVNHFLSVNLAGFESVVNAIGGVPICISQPLVDPLSGVNMPHPGCYHLNGEQALAFVRVRHNTCDPIPDFGRISRQQQFLRAVLSRVLRPSMFTRAPSIINSVAGNLTIDKGLNLAELVYLTRQLQGVDTGAVDFRSVPGVTAMIGSASAVRLQQPEANQLFARLRAGNPLGTLGKTLPLTAESPANVKVQVYDSSSGGKADQVLQFLTTSGFDIEPNASTGGPSLKGPAILYAPQAADKAKVVQGFLTGLPMKQVPKSTLGGASVGVVITAAYNGPGVATPSPAPSGGGGGSTTTSC